MAMFERGDAANKDQLVGISSDIIYIIPVEDGDPSEASLLQGFARSLMRNVPIIRLINSLPSDIMELSVGGREVRLARRMSGQAPEDGMGNLYGRLPVWLRRFPIPLL